jgi:hypothetical protein
MDRFEDQFKNAFADYRVPVSDKVWDKVKAKRKVIYWWKRPSFQIAAAILLLVSVVWSVTDSVGKFQNSGSATHEIAEIGSQKPGGNSPETLKGDVAKKPSANVSKVGVDMASVGQKLTNKVNLARPGKQQILPIPIKELALEDNDNPDGPTNPVMEMVSLDRDVTKQIPQGMDILPNRIKPIHTFEYGPSLKLPASLTDNGLPQNDFASNKNTPPQNEDKTGPDFLISQLENLRPGLFDGLRNIASRTTEIEIIW